MACPRPSPVTCGGIRFQAAQRERAAIKPPSEPALSPCPQRPLEERRDELSRVVAGVDNILFSEALVAEGALVFAKACKLGLEGIVSKRAGSRYWSGNCRNWTKAKNPSFARLALHEKRRVNSGDVRVRPKQHEENQANCDRDRISRTSKRLPFDVL